MIILVNLLGLALIALIVWWFWMAKSFTRHSAANVVAAEHDLVAIDVENGVYTPDTIHVKKGKTITLRFTRKDPNPCAEMVLLPDFNTSAELPLNKPYDMKLTPEKEGEFEFTCQMGMYRGQLVVE